MPDTAETIATEILAIAKDVAGRTWSEADSAFVKERAIEIGKLSVKIAAASTEDRKALRQEVRVEKASSLLRISRQALRGGGAFREFLKRTFTVLYSLLTSRLNLRIQL